MVGRFEDVEGIKRYSKAKPPGARHPLSLTKIVYIIH